MPRIFFTFLCVLVVGATLEMPAQLTDQWRIVESGAQFSYTVDCLSYFDESNFVYSGQRELNVFVNYSSDGGDTWQNILESDWITDRDGDQVSVQYHSTTLPAPGLVFVVASFRKSPTQFLPFILRSRDYGANWDTVYIADDYLRFYSFNIKMADAQRGFAVLDDLYKTEDAGATWNKVESTFDLSTFKYLEILSDNIVFAADFSSVYRSVDFGLNWQAFPKPDGVDRGFSFLDESTGWAAGAIPNGVGDQRENVIYNTSDGGASWQVQKQDLEPSPWGLRDIAFADPLNGIAVGNVGIIARTTDGGLNWTGIPTPYDAYQKQILRVVYPAHDRAIAINNSSVMQYAGQEFLIAPMIQSEKGAGDFNYMLTWSAIEGAEKYDVQIAAVTPGGLNFETTDFSKNTIAELTELSATSLEIAEYLEYNTKYYCRVRARGTIDSDWSRPVNFVTVQDPDFVELSRPVLVHPVPDGSTPVYHRNIEFAWEPVSGATEYELQLASNPAFNASDTQVFTNINATTFIIDELPALQAHFWRLRAIATSAASEWSIGAFGTHAILTSVGGQRESQAGMNVQVLNASPGIVVKLDLPSADLISLTVRDLNGRPVMQLFTDRQLAAGSHTFELPTQKLSTGMYFLVAESSAAGTVTGFPYVE